MTPTVVYQGPSAIDGSAIVAIITRGSVNAKTGPMDQLWILPDISIAPHLASKVGADRAVCGDCPHRHSLGGDCYVTLFQAPLSVHKTYMSGGYVDGTQDPAPCVGRAVRLGAYGDPGALPLSVIDRVVTGATRWTGYTHQWRTRPDLRRYCMASVDNESEAQEARASGWRYFRVASTGEPVEGEIHCPSVTRGITCLQCGLCDGVGRLGTSVRSIVIAAHGARSKSKKGLKVMQ